MIELIGKELFQWNKGRQLKINADANKAVFSTDNVQGISRDIIDNIVTIPDSLLKEGKPILVYITIEDEEQRQVIRRKMFNVIPAPMPEDYEETEEAFTKKLENLLDLMYNGNVDEILVFTNESPQWVNKDSLFPSNGESNGDNVDFTWYELGSITTDEVVKNFKLVIPENTYTEYRILVETQKAETAGPINCRVSTADGSWSQFSAQQKTNGGFPTCVKIERKPFANMMYFGDAQQNALGGTSPSIFLPITSLTFASNADIPIGTKATIWGRFAE